MNCRSRRTAVFLVMPLSNRHRQLLACDQVFRLNGTITRFTVWVIPTPSFTRPFQICVHYAGLYLGHQVHQPAYYLAFHIPKPDMANRTFSSVHNPFWTSNIIRMISWIPFLRRNGVRRHNLDVGASSANLSNGFCSVIFTVILAFVHLYIVHGRPSSTR
jgi:putative spermidine/putrescine transport system permease protein